MPWRSAEQRESEPEPDYRRPRLVDGVLQLIFVEPDHQCVPSTANFDLDDRDFRCTCTTCRPELANRKKTTDQPRRTMPSDLDDVLTALRPNLIKTARHQLQNRGLDEQFAEDVVQDALARYFDRAPEYRGPHKLGGWLRKTIGWIAAEGLRRRDLLDQGCVSLDEDPRPRGDY